MPRKEQQSAPRSMSFLLRITGKIHHIQSADITAVVLYGTFGLLMFGPLAFGAVEFWSTFIVETGAVLLTLLWLAHQWSNREISIVWNPLFLPMAAFGALIFLQIGLGTSSYRHDTLYEAAIYIAYGLLCFLAT